jgi:hypothetical protein
MLTVRVPLAIRKPRGGRKLILTPGGMAPRGSTAADTTLVKALARAFRWRRMLETGRYGTIDELAAAEKINSSYVSRLLRLTLLAPDIVQAILDGTQSASMMLPGLMEPFPVEWERQFGEAGADNAERPPDCPHRLGGALSCGHRTMPGTIIPSYLNPSALPLLRTILSR